MLEHPLTELEGEQDHVRVQLCEDELVLYFPYHKTALQTVKKLAGASYSASDKAWIIPLDTQNIYPVQDTILSLRKHFRREAVANEQRENWCREIAGTLAENLASDFEHPALQIDAEAGCISLSVPYDPKSIRLLKKIEGARWDSSAKVWLLPADEERKIRTTLKAVLKNL